MAVVTDLESVNRQVTDIMRHIYGHRLAKIVLYGSYARGDYHEQSDVDYLVVLHDEEVSAFTELKYTTPALNDRISDIGAAISTIVVSKGQLVQSTRPFFKEVRKDGKCIYE